MKLTVCDCVGALYVPAAARPVTAATAASERAAPLLSLLREPCIVKGGAVVAVVPSTDGNGRWCDMCGRIAGMVELLRCSGCKQAFYCGDNSGLCQELAWRTHWQYCIRNMRTRTP